MRKYWNVSLDKSNRLEIYCIISSQQAILLPKTIYVNVWGARSIWTRMFSHYTTKFNADGFASNLYIYIMLFLSSNKQWRIQDFSDGEPTPKVEAPKQLPPNTTLQLENGLCCIKHCWSVYEQNSIVNSVRIDNRTTYKVITSSNVSKRFQKTAWKWQKLDPEEDAYPEMHYKIYVVKLGRQLNIFPIYALKPQYCKEQWDSLAKFP